MINILASVFNAAFILAVAFVLIITASPAITQWIDSYIFSWRMTHKRR